MKFHRVFTSGLLLIVFAVAGCSSASIKNSNGRKVANEGGPTPPSFKSQIACLRVIAPLRGRYDVWPFGFQGDLVLSGKSYPNVRANVSYVDSTGHKVTKKAVLVFSTDRDGAFNETEQKILDELRLARFNMITSDPGTPQPAITSTESLLASQGFKNPEVSFLYFSTYPRDYFVGDQNVWLLRHPDISSSEAPVFKVRKGDWVGYVRPSIVGDVDMAWDQSKKPLTPLAKQGDDVADSEDRVFPVENFSKTNKKLSQKVKVGGEPVIDLVALPETESSDADGAAFSSFSTQILDLYYLSRDSKGARSAEMIAALNSPECHADPQIDKLSRDVIARIQDLK